MLRLIGRALGFLLIGPELFVEIDEADLQEAAAEMIARMVADPS